MDDFYKSVENAALVLVREHTDNKDKYFKKPLKQVIASDDSVLGEGYEYFFITYPGAFPVTKDGEKIIWVTWSMDVEIYTRFSTYEKTWADFKAFRSDIFNLFNVKMIGNTLNRTPFVRSVLLSSQSKPIAYGEEESPSDPIFFSQTMLLAVEYKINRQ